MFLSATVLRPGFYDQLCYEVDLNEIIKEPSFNDLKSGLVFILDYNEDRQTLDEIQGSDQEDKIIQMTRQGLTFVNKYIKLMYVPSVNFGIEVLKNLGVESF